MAGEATIPGEQTVSGRIDSASGKPLPKGVFYRGSKQYMARKVVNDRRVQQTLSTAALARRWLTETAAKAELGQFTDTGPLDKETIGDLVDRYVKECMEGRGADLTGHVPAILRDPDLLGHTSGSGCRLPMWSVITLAMVQIACWLIITEYRLHIAGVLPAGSESLSDSTKDMMAKTVRMDILVIN